VPDAMEHRDAEKRLLACMLNSDRRGAGLLVDQWAAESGYERAVNELLDPVLQRFGEIWACDEDVSLAQGYISAKIAEDIMLKAAQAAPSAEQEEEPKRTVVLGNIEDDYHALGRKLVATFLRADGWHVIDLGNDVLSGRFVDTAIESGARVIGASAMMYANAVNIKKLRAEIEGRGLGGSVKLAVGGAVFRIHPELVTEVGGDGTAPNALAASGLIGRLWDEAEAARTVS